MATVLYRDGETVHVRPSDIQNHINLGWSFSKNERKPEEETPKMAKDDELAQLRNEGAAAGIEGAHKMRKATLKKKLGYDDSSTDD